jgi:hypothetical protein
VDVSDTVTDSDCMTSHFFDSLQNGHHLGLNLVIQLSDRFKYFFLLKLLLLCEFLILKFSHELSFLCLLFHFLKASELIFYDIFSCAGNFLPLAFDQLIENFLQIVQD